MVKQEIIFKDLGRMDYQRAWDYQEILLQQNVSKKKEWSELKLTGHLIQDSSITNSLNSHTNVKDNLQSADGAVQTIHHLIFVEHLPVYTIGKSGKEEHILIDYKALAAKGIDYIKTNRGGDITFHGPGQVVGYPILDLEKFDTDIGKYLRNLEQVIILTMAAYGLKGERSTGETGVWMDAMVKGRERKICALGVRCSRWITMHGFAFNVNTELAYFDNIVPCGIRDKQVTSLQKELGKKIDIDEVKEILKYNFEKVFDSVLVY
ncbi:MAG: lipoyl(octanoyl) transferase LipB [Chitinophagaceae bacterium]